MLDERQERFCRERPSDHGDLRALFLNCTLKPSPATSHTEGQGSGLHAALGGRGMPITAFYSADGKLLDVGGGALAHDALLERLRELYGAEV